MNYGEGKYICIMIRGFDGSLTDDPRPYWQAMPKMRPSRYADGDDCWILEEDFYLRVGRRIICIKKGFDFDGASIPKWAWTIIGHPMQMWILLAAIPHDGIYASNLLPQEEIDWMFLEIIQACDRATPSHRKWAVTRLSETNWKWRRRNECWLAVRGAGGFVFRKKLGEILFYREIVSIIDLDVKPLEGLLIDIT
jgi:hypothetical protein